MAQSTSFQGTLRLKKCMFASQKAKYYDLITSL